MCLSPCLTAAGPWGSRKRAVTPAWWGPVSPQLSHHRRGLVGSKGKDENLQVISGGTKALRTRDSHLEPTKAHGSKTFGSQKAARTHSPSQKRRELEASFTLGSWLRNFGCLQQLMLHSSADPTRSVLVPLALCRHRLPAERGTNNSSLGGRPRLFYGRCSPLPVVTFN